MGISFIAASSPASRFLSSSCAAAEAGCRHFAVSSPSYYLPVSVKNVGGLEDGGGTELVSEDADVEMLRASGRLLAARPAQPAPSSGVTRLLETAGIARPERSPPCRDPPCALRLHPEPGHWLTWDNLSRSGKAASGS